ncbi:relaxase/mobilization nuclease domain-containing protein [Colwellia sp. 4_MG-2023]|uniref:relaxase/mobilization nuclease domain-containing protein n=1 Tax=unclassified Colwellia TaxID=196834 RepID=UPI0026E46EDE|nr:MULTISPECIES: relaxase/mobilization nuclease domain-containing protein [unclassified Colwellia]MDO6508752.1 relaxase/mobilization nuclease domain-containing protein [Colwellia sp. 5_MG-2023]MDO6557417.1 relaxase/mobilization nuclease domain-containing protein [Colwellia sp. 4_MG-2023]
MSGGIDYLLNNKDSSGQIRSVAPIVQRGDADLTKAVIDSITNKNRYTSGVLSFEESDIKQDVINNIIEDFEKTIFCGFEKNRYNSLWIEHNDKNRKELHFVFTNIDLKSEKSFTPYLHKIDKKRVDYFKQLTNQKNNFSSPDSAYRAQLTQSNASLPRDKKELLVAIDEHFSQMFVDGHLKNGRDDVIKELQKLNYEVKRKSENFITIQVDSSDSASKDRLRLKGKFYEQHFKNDQHFETTNTKTEGFSRERNSNYFERIQREFEQSIDKRAAKNLKKYGANDREIQPNSITKFETNESNIERRIEKNGDNTKKSTNIDKNKLDENASANIRNSIRINDFIERPNEVLVNNNPTKTRATKTVEIRNSNATTNITKNHEKNTRHNILQRPKRPVFDIPPRYKNIKNNNKKGRVSFKNKLKKIGKISHGQISDFNIKIAKAEQQARIAIDFIISITKNFRNFRKTRKAIKERYQYLKNTARSISSTTKRTNIESTNTKSSAQKIDIIATKQTRTTKSIREKIGSIDRIIELKIEKTTYNNAQF